jgi:hypothetical protein
MNMRASYTESKSRSQKHPKRQGHGSEQDVCPVAWRRFSILSSPLSLFDFTVASERRSGAILVDAGGNHSLSDIDDSGVSGSVIVVSSVSAKLNGYNTGELDGCLHMTRFEKIAIIALVIVTCCGCADTRMQRSDEEAMLIYRDCMGGMPPPWESGDVSAGLGSKHVASASAGADSRRESRQHTECMQRAAWEEK